MTEENKNENESKASVTISKKKRISILKRNSIKSKEKKNKDENKSKELKSKNVMLKNLSPFNSCINSLLVPTDERILETSQPIVDYLKTLKNFMNTLSNESDEQIEKVLFEVSSVLQYEKFDKNKFICKFGEKADKFYLILKGKVIFLVPTKVRHYLNEEEYLEHLLKLRKKGEIELVKNILIENQLNFYFGEDFDEFILTSLDKFEKKKENVYSKKLYKLFYEFRIFKEKEKNNLIKKEENADIDEYIKMSIVNSYDDPDYAKIKKQKLLTIFKYKKTNIFEDGDSFGSVGANSKSNKRTATSISYENCYLGVLSKKDYIDILEKINSKQRNFLFNLILSIKLFRRMTKNIFINYYIHMFHFTKFDKNDIIMNDSEKFDKMIILYKGEFTLSINKNILELYDLIINIQKIKGKLMNLPEDKIKKDLAEVEKNKLYLINMKNSSHNIDTKELIMKKKYFIISEVKTELILGYPNTVDPETHMPLFSCKCFSKIAAGYKIENDMLKYIARDNYLRTKPPEMTVSKIDVVLSRLLELENIMYSKIVNTEKNSIVVNKDNNKKNNNENNLEKSIDFNKKNKDDDNADIATLRNANPQKFKNTRSVLFYLHKKVLSNDNIKKSFIQRQNLASPMQKALNAIENNNNTNSEINKESLNKFVSLILKLKHSQINKAKLLKEVQRKSNRYLTKEKLEINQLQMKINRLKSKEEYCDLSNLFSKTPISNKAMFEFENIINKEDNVLDPILNDIKRKINYDTKISSNLIKNKNTDEYDINNISQEKYLKLLNLYSNEINQDQNNRYANTNQTNKKCLILENKSKSWGIKNLTNKTKFSMTQKKNKFGSLYKERDFSSNNYKQSFINPEGFESTIIDINNNISKTNYNYNNTENNIRDLHNMLYFKYIMTELKGKNKNNKYQSLSMEKNKSLNYNQISRINNKSKNIIMPSIRKNFRTNNNFGKNLLNYENKNIQTQTHYENKKLSSFSEECVFPFVDLLTLDKLNSKYKKEK